MLRIGVPLVGGWEGGLYYTEAVLRALNACNDRRNISINFIDGLVNASIITETSLLELADHCIRLGHSNNIAGYKSNSIKIDSYGDLREHVDILFPINSDIMLGLPHVSWIPDFQHVDMPQYFSAEDILRRNRSFNRIRNLGGDVVVSSEAMRDRLLQLWPGFRGRVHVISFSSALTRDVLEDNSDHVLQTYGLSQKYLICCNQMWQHKNHTTLIRAFDAYCTRNPHEDLTLVLTGKISDYRVKGSGYLPKDIIAKLEAQGRLRLLGFVPRADQIQMIRRSLALIQPSLYEGWNTSLEEARFLGKTIIASDIAVHREQNLPGALYFAPLDEQELASLIEYTICNGEHGFDLDKERVAWQEGEKQRISFGQKLIAALSEAAREQEKYFSGNADRTNLERDLGSLLWSQNQAIERLSASLKARKISRKIKGIFKRMREAILKLSRFS
ncbi:MAG: glycosyltransferase family 4 protein [Rhodomicrobium sp.]